jgi:uncharacterized protein (DUF362 family)
MILEKRVAVSRNYEDLAKSIHETMELSGILSRIKNGAKIAIKPNFTYPYYKKGVTTSPKVIREIVKILRDYSSRIAIVETDGGYGAWLAREAFIGHGMYELGKEFSLEIVNLCEEPSEFIVFDRKQKEYRLPLPSRLLHECDIMISMPVPKIHCMTGLSLSYKNQWGCVPDIMRLRRHYIFDEAIVAINRALKPAVVADGTYFLDNNGPMEGKPIQMNIIISASEAGSFDRYVSELMGFPWERVKHLKCAAASGDMPTRLEDISFNCSPSDVQSHIFHLRRSLRNYIALMGFKSRFVTWLGYESWVGREIFHRVLYALAGKPVKPGAIKEG